MKSAVKQVNEPTYTQFIVGDIGQYDATQNAFSLMTYDTEYEKVRARQMKNMTEMITADTDTFMEMAFRGGAWAVAYSVGNISGVYSWGGQGMLSWNQLGRSPFPTSSIRTLDPTDRDYTTGWIKKAAHFYGADLAGICEVNPRWIYSHVYNILTKKTSPVNIPATYKYAIVMALELDYDLIQQSPRPIAAAATGLGYSHMIEVAVKMAEFVRNLGYNAIPMGNDTALSHPLAVDAGLGELGRNGMLITAKFGPRVRLCKVFTDLPLIPDKPVDLGIQGYCEKCRICAEACPTHAIPAGERTVVRGLRKWAIDPLTCFQGWADGGVDCTHCITVCPKSKPASS
jgi:epoxyqueuosine reductase